MNEFDPVRLSTQENAFVLAHVGEPPVVAMREVPPSVNKKAVRPIIERAYELGQLEQHAGLEWIGLEAVKNACKVYMEQAELWALDRRKGRPRYPSMYTYDSRGRAFRYGPGSDAGQVRTYFNSAGERVKFAIELLPSNEVPWQPSWTAADLPKSGLKVDAAMKRIECLVCNHTEGYNPESRGSFNAARARMSKHLRTATEETSQHREVHTQEFA